MPLKCTKKLSKSSLIFKFTVTRNSLIDIINRLVNTLPKVLLNRRVQHFGRPRYSTAELLKTLVYCYAIQVTSGRRMQHVLLDNTSVRWLLDDPNKIPSYRTLDRFRVSEDMQLLIDGSFDIFRQWLVIQHIIDSSAVFIDGTKIEAAANKYSFVWRKIVVKNNTRLNDKVRSLMTELRTERLSVPAGIDNPIHALESAQHKLQMTIKHLNKIIAHEGTIPGGSVNKQRRRRLKHYLHVITRDYLPRKKKYLKYFGIFAGRNSFSKTDLDATFMRLKEDPMRNGQLKPAYNVQIATQNRYVIAYDVFQRPTDQKTLMPFLKTMNWHYWSVQAIAADAGYGSEPNYHFITTHHHIPLIPYNMYEKEKTRKYKNDPSKVMNWFHDPAGRYYVDNHGIRFDYLYHGFRKDHKTGYVREYDYYKAQSYGDPERFYYSQTRTCKQRRIAINATWEEQKCQERKFLENEPGKSIYAKRKDEVESVFGTIKEDLNFRRFHVRKLKNVTIESGLIMLAYNIRKYVKYLANKNESK